jgi:hypothetical protein
VPNNSSPLWSSRDSRIRIHLFAAELAIKSAPCCTNPTFVGFISFSESVGFLGICWNQRISISRLSLAVSEAS